MWDVLERLRVSFLQEVGLVLQLHKVEAYNANIEHARVGAPPGIKWPEFNGHHGISILNVPLGLDKYIHSGLSEQQGRQDRRPHR